MNEQRGFPTATRSIPRTSPPVLYDYDTDEPRTNTSTRHYVGQVTPRTVVRFTTHREPIQRASRIQQQTRTQAPVQPAPVQHVPVARQKHWLFYAGGVLFFMLFGWILLSVISNWWNGLQDDWHYGRPRTAQYDENVGHGGISHFTVENLQGHILIIEVVPTDPSKAKIYVGPTLAGANADLAPATLTFPDVNDDNLVDMVLTVENTKYTFLNSKDGSFHAMNGGNA